MIIGLDSKVFGRIILKNLNKYFYFLLVLIFNVNIIIYIKKDKFFIKKYFVV